MYGVAMMEAPCALRSFKRPRDEDTCTPFYITSKYEPAAKHRRKDPAASLPPSPPQELAALVPGRFVRVDNDTRKVASLHQYPFYGPNPCPAARCGWHGLIVETGCGEWQRGIKVRFQDGVEWCYHPSALLAYEPMQP